MIRSLVVLVTVAIVGRAVQRDGWSYVVHNVIGHPLLTLAPSLGERIHDATIPETAP